MTVESATYIGQLSPTYPTGSDAKSEGDSHLRLIKAALQASFPSLGNAAMTATAAQLNALASSSGLLSVGTSTTSNSIGTGSKTFTTQTGLGFAAGQSVRVQDNASLSNYMLGTISSYTTATGSITVSVTTTGGSGTIADWSISPVVQSPMLRRAITTTDTVAAADWGGLIDATSGTFTLAVTAVSALPAGFWVIVRNSGTGVVTVDPNSSETIGGASTLILYPKQAALIYVSGSNLDYLTLEQPAIGVVSSATASGSSVVLTPAALRNATYRIVLGQVTTSGSASMQLNGNNLSTSASAESNFIIDCYFDSSGNAACVSHGSIGTSPRSVYVALTGPTTLTVAPSSGTFSGGTITFIRLT